MRHKYLIVAVVLVTTAGFLARGPALAQRYISNDFVLTHVRVFDGARTLQDTQVAVSGGVIRAVGGDPVAWRHLPTIDATGSTLVPGLIDAHAHVMDAGDLRQALRFGVTTVLDMAATRAEERELFALRVRARAATDMADLRSAGFPATAPGAHGTEFATEFPAVGSVADAKAFVATRQVEGSDYLKIILNGLRSANTGIQNLDEPTAKVLVDAAHAAGLLAVAHVETIGDVDVALAAGIDGLVHVWRRGGADPTRARRLADRKVFVIPALAIPDGFVPEGRANLLVDPRLVPLLSSTIRGHLGRSFSSPTVTDEIRRTNLAGSMAATRSLHAAGVTLLVGTDASPGNPAAQGISVHREIELFRQAGLSPAEILAAATMNSAVAFRMPDRGRILPGYRADLLLVRGDPTSDLLSIRDIARVWKGGVEVDRTVAER